jgi:hypothetical protein
MNYCDTPDEVKKNPVAKKWIYAITNGNPDAFEMGWRIWNFNHMFDDLIDRDKDAPKELILGELVKFVEALSFNPFWNLHKQSIFPLMVSLAQRTLDAEDFEGDIARCLRCGDLDLFAHIAYLCGGWEHMRKMKDLRTYDLGE